MVASHILMVLHIGDDNWEYCVANWRSLDGRGHAGLVRLYLQRPSFRGITAEVLRDGSDCDPLIAITGTYECGDLNEDTEGLPLLKITGSRDATVRAFVDRLPSPPRPNK